MLSQTALTYMHCTYSRHICFAKSRPSSVQDTAWSIDEQKRPWWGLFVKDAEHALQSCKYNKTWWPAMSSLTGIWYPQNPEAFAVGKMTQYVFSTVWADQLRVQLLGYPKRVTHDRKLSQVAHRCHTTWCSTRCQQKLNNTTVSTLASQ